MSDFDKPLPEPLIFGEVLFDHFSDGSRVLGGAPFNVAWHLQGFGVHPLLVSAVGADETGRAVVARMEEWGMRTTGLQVDPSHPTGRVTASIVDGEPVFEIRTEQAYDYVRRDDALDALDALDAVSVALIYHGTLASRAEVSRETLGALQTAARAPAFVDLNLREPWWTRERLDDCLEGAHWLKLNSDELGTVTGKSIQTLDACREHALALAGACGLDAAIVTLGSRGSLMARGGASWVVESERMDPADVVDTVGAGDAFSAVACLGLLADWAAEDILKRGNAFAADICGIRGATTRDRSLYERHRAEWGRA